MTREEEIKEAALKYAEKIDYDLWLDTEHPKSYAKMLVMATAEDNAKWADEHPKNHWIRVEDKRPEYMKDVLVVFIEEDKPHIGIGSCYPDEYGGIYWRIDGFGLFSGRITHWKQLPELPKEEEAL